MAQLLARVKAALFGTVACEAPDERQEPPVIFDESENPALQELARRHPLRPPAFEMLLQSFRAATMIEPLEGLKVDFGMSLSPRMQFSNSWTLPHGQPGNYEMTLIFVGGKLATSPMDMSPPNPLMMSRFTPSLGRQDVKLICHPSEDVELRLSGNYMSTEPRESQVQVEADYQGTDFVSGAKVGVGLEFLSYHYTQSLTRNLALGFEVMKMVKPQPMVGLSLGGRYLWGDHQLFMQYLVYSKGFTLGTLLKGNKNIVFSTEFTYNTMTGETDFNAGVTVRFLKARFQALVSGSAKLTAQVQHAINPFAKLSLNAEADLIKQDQKFGIAVNFGGS